MARGQSKGQATTRSRSSRTGSHVDGAPWRPAELQREYRSLLDSAKDDPQEILDSDGSMLVIETKSQHEFLNGLSKSLAEISQFRAAYREHRGQEPTGWVAQTPFPWLRSLPAEGVDEFAAELLPSLLDAAARQTLENYEGNLVAWKSTAEIQEQPEVLEAMLADIDLDALEEVFPPSEDEVREAESGDAVREAVVSDA